MNTTFVLYWSAEEINRSYSEDTGMVQVERDAFSEIKFGLIRYILAYCSGPDCFELENIINWSLETW